MVDHIQTVIQHQPVSAQERVGVPADFVVVPMVDHIQTVIQHQPVSAQERVSVTPQFVIVPIIQRTSRIVKEAEGCFVRAPLFE